MRHVLSGPCGIVNLKTSSYDRYVTLKVCTITGSASPYVHRELAYYDHVDKLKSKHVVQAYTRPLLDSFYLRAPDGTHTFLVHPPMHMALRKFYKQSSACKPNGKLLRNTILNVLCAFDFPHSEARVVYAGEFIYIVCPF